MNAYVSNLQVGGQVVGFLTRRLGNPIPSPALFNHIGNRLRREVHAFAEEHDVLILKLKLKKVDRTRFDDRKIDHVRSCMDKAERLRVASAGSPSCPPRSFSGSSAARTGQSPVAGRTSSSLGPSAGWASTTFYVLDPECSPGFVKIAT